MTEDEAAELDELRQRIYGPDSTTAFTEAELERLRALETVSAPSAPINVSVTPDAELGDADSSLEPELVSAVPLRAQRRPWRYLLVATVAGLALTGIGYAVGVMVTTPEASEALPEFAFDQTDEDLLPESFLAEDDTLDPASTRFVGRIDGYAIYLAQNAQSDGVCALALTEDAPPVAVSMGCFGPMTGDGGGSFGVTDTLEIGLGARHPEPQGIPIRLSESVTAYRS